MHYLKFKGNFWYFYKHKYFNYKSQIVEKSENLIVIILKHFSAVHSKKNYFLLGNSKSLKE